MARYWAVKHTTGVLTWSEGGVDNTPDENGMLQAAVALLGGVAADWEVVELTEAQHNALRAAIPTRSKLVGDTLSQNTAMTASLTANTVTANGVATITLNVDCHDGTYTGKVWVTITPPFAEPQRQGYDAVGGLVAVNISTVVLGEHQLQVETLLNGVWLSSFEGV